MLLVVLFLPEFPKIFTRYSLFIPMPTPIIPILFYTFHPVDNYSCLEFMNLWLQHNNNHHYIILNILIVSVIMISTIHTVAG